MLLRFIGDYSNGRASMRICDIVFHEREPSEVTDPESIRRLSGHPEFEAVEAADKPKRGRPRKVTHG